MKLPVLVCIQFLCSFAYGKLVQPRNVTEQLGDFVTENKQKEPVEDLGEQVKNFEYYEVVTPIEFSSGNLDGDEKLAPGSKHIQISAFNTRFDINIYKDYTNSSYSVFVEYFGTNNSYEGKIVHEEECIYSGHANTLSNQTADVILNVCDGLEGIIQTESATIFIEPVKNTLKRQFPHQHIIYRSSDVVNTKSTGFGDYTTEEPFDMPVIANKNKGKSRVRRSGYDSYLKFKNKSGRSVQLYYLDSYKRERPFPPRALFPGRVSGVNTFTDTIWIVKDDKTNKKLLLNGKEQYVAPLSSIGRRIEIIITTPTGLKFVDEPETNEVEGSERHIEVMVVVDESVTKFHGRDKVEKYVFTMMKTAALVLKDKSLGISINFHVVRLVIIDNSQTGFRVYSRNPSRTLVSACNYISTLQNNDETHRDHFDFAVALTRKDFGPSGYAQLYSMCTSSRSCVIVQDEGFTSAFIVAHETGHLLGLDHDGEGESKKCDVDRSKGSVMAPTIVSRPDRFHWSSCSKKLAKENIEYFSCLKNVPKHKKQCTGACDVPYTLTEQCQFNFGSSSTACTAWKFNPCQKLWCQNPQRRNNCQTNSNPALDGSICGRNKHCSKGLCVPDTNPIFPARTTKKMNIVHGNWGSWYSWSSCSQSCGVGIRKKIRKCDSPKPGPNGSPCFGKNIETDLCNTEACSILKSYKSIRAEQCRSLESKGWTLYTDNAFNVRLKQRYNNVNCSFEEGFCNWKNSLNNNMDWRMNSGKTKSYKTGPSNDHTFKNEKGKYVFIEASISYDNKVKKGDVARLISPNIRVPRICFNMFYHMYGRDMGSLKIKLLYANSTEQEVWNKSGNQGDSWKNMQISLQSVSDYRIVVEAVRGVYWTSDIAIDDISVVAGLCNSDQKDQNPCVISCRSRNAQSFKMNIKVKDGTKCYSNRSSDVCLEGVCKKFGCDNKFGSSLTFDNCMVCGGDGSSCIRQTDKIELTATKDYEILLKLPKGSTFINITETSHKPHYIGLRRMFHNSIYLSTKYEDYFVIDGVSFHFQKVSNGFQHISCQGPLQKDIDVVAYTFTSERIRPLSLAYEYFGPISGKVTYQYKINRWQTCSRSCGTGKQQSVVACIRLQDSQEVNHKHCRHQKKPLYIRSCNLQECRRKFKWVIRKWSDCSKTCGADSRKTRVVECLNVFENVLTQPSFCPRRTPITTIRCPTKECPRVYKWTTGEWKSCSKSCGIGTRTRTVKCIDAESKNTVDDVKCVTKSKPNVLEPCNIQECDIFIWRVHLEGKCSQTCGGGYKVRIVYCVNEKTKLFVENRYCDGPSPQRIVRCNEQQCPEYAWGIVESSPCSVTCGNGTKERTIQCVDKATNQNTADKKCLHKKPPKIISCYERKCPGFNVAYTTWGSCSAACGRGIQKREAYCVSENYETILSPKECAKGDLLLKRSCQRTPCARSDKLFCNFDSQTYCDWENTKDDDFDWTIGKSTPSINTGPSKDHTTRSGYFAYIEASRPRKRGHKAELTSKYLKMKKGCLEFWYYMKGPSVGQLRVRAVSSLGERVAFEREAHQGGRWLQAKILANETEAASGYKYVIEGIVGYGVYGDIAIDDIKFHDKSCGKITVLKNCREISPYCRHEKRNDYCVKSEAYRKLCCKTCAAILT